MALGEVKLSQSLPVSRPVSVSSKREFEKIISDICRIAASAKGISGHYLEALIPKSQDNANKQWWSQLGGSVGQAGFAALGVVIAVSSRSPESFQMYSKVGDIFKGISDANQSTYQMEQQKNQHASTQWQTWANGLQDLVRNLETAKQRLQQMEDANNR
jgi:hypothetical protein